MTPFPQPPTPGHQPARLPYRLGGRRWGAHWGQLLLTLFACLGGGFALPSLLAGGEPSTFPPQHPVATTPGPRRVPEAQHVATTPTLATPPASAHETQPIAPIPGPRLVPEAQHVATTPASAPTPALSPAPAAPRLLDETELLTHLTAALQPDDPDRGELELKLTRPWAPRPVPEGQLTLKILELPNAGLTPHCLLRFTLEVRPAHAAPEAAPETHGPFQTTVQARLWREIWVAKSAAKRGDRVADADLARERRDVLPLREPLADFPAGDPTLELAQPLSAGAPLLARAVRVRPVIHRGQLAEARLQDGALHITLKVEALEDGAPGQRIRARNPLTRRDLTGTVLDEQTILIPL